MLSFVLWKDLFIKANKDKPLPETEVRDKYWYYQKYGYYCLKERNKVKGE